MDSIGGSERMCRARGLSVRYRVKLVTASDPFCSFCNDELQTDAPGTATVGATILRARE